MKSDNLHDPIKKLFDYIADFVGSEGFIIFQTCFILSWVIINTILIIENAFDKYPYIFLNLVLAIESVLITPMILMKQNYDQKEDRRRAKTDLEMDIKSEKYLEAITGDIKQIKEKLGI